MARGRPPVPTAVKQLRGTYRADRARNEPRPQIRAPRCPPWLSPVAKREWRRLAKQLVKLGLLSDLDRAVFSSYCQSYGRWKQAEEAIQRHGILIKTPNGHLQQSPAVSLARAALKQMLAAAAELGLSPAARTRINVQVPAAPKTQMERLLEEVV